MNKNIVITLVVLVFLIGFGFVISGGRDKQSGNEGSLTSVDGEKVVIHKSPTCGCCGVYSSYLKKEGYGVEENNMADMSVVKQSLGVPYELESCHTSEIGGYVVEGHVPNEAIEKLLSEKPDIKGIGMAGMPAGSPGMPGPKANDFLIYEITHEGAKGEIFMVI